MKTKGQKIKLKKEMKIKGQKIQLKKEMKTKEMKKMKKLYEDKRSEDKIEKRNEDKRSEDKIEKRNEDKRNEENEKTPKLEEKNPSFNEESSESISEEEEDGKKQKKKKKKKKEAVEIEARLKKVAHPIIIPQTSLPLKAFSDYTNRRFDSRKFKMPCNQNADKIIFLLAKNARPPNSFSQILNAQNQMHKVSDLTMVPEIGFKKSIESNRVIESDKTSPLLGKTIEETEKPQPRVENIKRNAIFRLIEFAEDQVKKLGLAPKDIICVEQSVKFSVEIFTNSINDLNY
ncbi:hypothetical protein SteCoe_35176 [Stentor coeruleus]|uniref:Uncharacterized protein n=1 Tax=Stentor coeruleus TaxID=5963 RepID=A0A1R2ASW1_9CILI|nr:hypothetical protein SteCoe_35176 [Stentor coeruleus]